VIGMLERIARNARVFTVATRDTQTIDPICQGNIIPGSVDRPLGWLHPSGRLWISSPAY